MKRKTMSAALALFAITGSAGAQTAERGKPCLTREEASAIMFVLAPEAIRAAGTACAQTLPATALLRQTAGPFLDSFQAESDRAWPIAKSGLAKLSSGGDLAGLDSELMKPLLSTLIVPMIAKEIKPQDCGKIDHIVNQLAPLPPQNLVELIVSVLEMTGDSRASKGKKNDFPICPALKQ
jgi:hypothetical protein